MKYQCSHVPPDCSGPAPGELRQLRYLGPSVVAFGVFLHTAREKGVRGRGATKTTTQGVGLVYCDCGILRDPLFLSGCFSLFLHLSHLSFFLSFFLLSLACSLPLSLSLSLALSLAFSHTLSLTLLLTHSFSRALSFSLTPSRSISQSLSLSHSLLRSCCRSLSCSPALSLLLCA